MFVSSVSLGQFNQLEDEKCECVCGADVFQAAAGVIWAAQGAWQPMPRSGSERGRKDLLPLKYLLCEVQP